MRITKKRLVWVAVGFVGLALLAAPKLLQQREKDITQAPRQGKSTRASQKVAVHVRIARPASRSELVKVPGTVLPNESVELKSESGGRIVRLLLREGADVKKGAVLVKINDADLRAQLEKAQAALTLAQGREERQKSLLDKGLVSKEDHDISRKELGASRADVDLLRALIDKTEIRAPFDGRVGLKYVSEGAYVSAGAKIADFVSVRPLKIEFSVPERYAVRIDANTTVSFSVQGSARRWNATIFARQPAIDVATRSLRMRALCREEAEGVYPGAFADVELNLGTNARALTAPTEAIVPDIKGQTVFLVRAGKAVTQRVSTGVRDESSVEIVDGLREGDTVVTSGVLMLRPGMAVDIKQIE